VSLDGAEAATHEWVRGVPGSFADATRGVRLLAEAGLRPQVIFSVMRRNAGEVEGIIALAVKLGAASVKFNIIQPTARGERLHEQELALSVQELIDLGRRVEKQLAPTTPLRLHFDYPLAFRPLSRLADGSANGRCGILGILGVLASGEYALCGIGAQVPELVFGRVGIDALALLWQENPVLTALRDGLPAKLEGVCGNCLMQTRCLGSCLAQNYYRAHHLWAPFWFCDEAEKADLFPASRRK
jgi:SynChlorMet cassette radical SAM/SPASM protein ScmF